MSDTDNARSRVQAYLDARREQGHTRIIDNVLESTTDISGPEPIIVGRKLHYLLEADLYTLLNIIEVLVGTDPVNTPAEQEHLLGFVEDQINQVYENKAAASE